MCLLVSATPALWAAKWTSELHCFARVNHCRQVKGTVGPLVIMNGDRCVVTLLCPQKKKEICVSFCWALSLAKLCNYAVVTEVLIKLFTSPNYLLHQWSFTWLFWWTGRRSSVQLKSRLGLYLRETYCYAASRRGIKLTWQSKHIQECGFYKRVDQVQQIKFTDTQKSKYMHYTLLF